jgi:CHAT domain-containing protein
MRLLRFRALVLPVLFGACGNAPPSTLASATGAAAADPGQELYFRGQVDSARTVWNAALEQARADGDSSAVARLLTFLGLAAYRTGDFEEARALGEAALTIKLTLNDDRELARSYNALGLLAMAEDRLMDGMRLFDRARASAEAAGDDRAAGTAAGNLGLIQAYLGDLDRASASLNLMLAAARAAADPRLEADALTNLAMVAIWSGDPQAALAPLTTAQQLYRDLDYEVRQQYALGQLATALAAMGDYQQALATLDSALVLARRHGLRDQEAENLQLLGGLLDELGDSRRALRHFEEAAAIAEELDMQTERGIVLRRAAAVNLRLGATAQALADAQTALAVHRQSGDVFEEIDDLLVIATAHRRAGDAARAAAALRSARVLAEQIGARSALAAVALAEARHYADSGEPREVLRAVSRARDAAVPADFTVGMESHSLAARAYTALGNADSAVVNGVAAVQALERVRAGLASTELRGSFASAAADVYGDAVLGLLRVGRTAEAFAVADGARSRELLQQLTSARATAAAAAQAPAPVTGQLTQSELLLRRIDALLEQLRTLEGTPSQERGAGAASTSDEILQRVALLRDEYESLTLRTAGHRSRDTRMLGVARVDEAEVRASLQDGEVLLHYTLTKDRLIVFAARRERIETFHVEVAAADIASRVRLLRELWAAPDVSVSRGMAAARGLHEILIAPMQRAGMLAGADRLIIVPHGSLEQLPFAALQDAATRNYLVEDFVVAYAPSANALLALRESRRTAAEDRRVSSFAPLTRSLPATRAEAVAAARTSTGGSVQLDRRATEAAVRTALAGPGVVHIASHGVLNARNPMFSRMELARGSAGGSGDDGRLEVHEVLGLAIGSSLVVLSGCETAIGEDWTGDPTRPSGLTTLAHAFLQAGALNVVATLWRVDDRGSEQLVRAFYERNGVDDAEALAQAQRSLIRNARYASPYYWAGYVIVGGAVRATAPPRATAASR